MPNTLQDFLAAATRKAAGDLAAALLRVPEDKRDWSPEGRARTALDQMAECALLNGYTVAMIQTRQWPDDAFAAYSQEKAEAVRDEAALNRLLQDNTERVVAAIGTVPDDALGHEIAMPWGAQTLAQIIAYPYWNMTYHEGQINYIAAMLGRLE